MKPIKIDKNVPIPPRGRGYAPKLPMKQLKVGDSFFIVTKSKTFGTVYNYNKTLKPKRFITRKYKRGFRVWRVK